MMATLSYRMELPDSTIKLAEISLGRGSGLSRRKFVRSLPYHFF